MKQNVLSLIASGEEYSDDSIDLGPNGKKKDFLKRFRL